MDANKLEYPLLDFFVAKAENKDVIIINDKPAYVGWVDTWSLAGSYTNPLTGQTYNPSQDWGFGGPIIEREKIAVEYDGRTSEWVAIAHSTNKVIAGYGPTPLVAAMRAYIKTKFGDKVEYDSKQR